jgi:general secretion pathway protein N
MGAGWAQSEGTLLKGRISGLHMQGQVVGDVVLKLRPLSLLRLSPTYDVQWGGAAGRGTGVIALKGETLVATQVTLQQDLSGIEGLAPPVRAIGGSVRLDQGAMTISRAGCASASGTISSDALSNAAAQYGRQFGELSGPLSCRDGDVVVALNGQSDAGDMVALNASASFLGQSNFDVKVTTQNGEVRYLLTQVGFVEQDGVLTYSKAR